MSNLPVLHEQKTDFLEQASLPWSHLDEALPMLETRAGNLSIQEALGDGYFSDPGVMSGSGQMIGPASALRVATVFACRRVISEDVAKMPAYVETMPRSKAKRERYDDHPVARLLQDRPNEWMSPMEMTEYLLGTACLHGSAYAYIHRDERGNPMELLPLLPGAVSVVQNQHWELTYTIASGQQTFDVGDGRNLLKLRGPLHTPTEAFRMTNLAREAIGLAASIEQAAARFHKNDLRPSGVLVSKGRLSKELVDRIKSEWQSKYGPGGEGGIAVLDQDFDFKSLNVTSADSQSLENRKFQIEEICRFFRVIPIMIGHNNGSTGYNGLEQLMMAHVKHTLQPWVVRLEQAMKRDLLDPRLDRGLYVNIDMDELMRGTLGDRVTAYTNMVKVAWTPNEIREREGLDPIDQPEMNRVQLQANNTGLAPGGKPPAADPSATAKPATEQPAPKG